MISSLKNFKRRIAAAPVVYQLTAIALGVSWYLALRAAPPTAEFIGPDSHHFPNSAAPGWALPFMCFTSWFLAVRFRGWIVASVGSHGIVPAVVLPFVGAAIFALLFTFVFAIEQDLFNLPLHEDLFKVFPAGMLMAETVAFAAFYVVIPMGFISQVVMGRVGRES